MCIAEQIVEYHFVEVHKLRLEFGSLDLKSEFGSGAPYSYALRTLSNPSNHINAFSTLY